MNRDDIIRMALEAGFTCDEHGYLWGGQNASLLDFAKLIILQDDRMNYCSIPGTNVRLRLPDKTQKTKYKNREHITDGSPCWCEPELIYVDPDTGVKVLVHKEPQ